MRQTRGSVSAVSSWKSFQSPGSPCVQKEDMDKIYPVYMAADVVVLAPPIDYWHLQVYIVRGL
ncbi:hypothetical protein SAMN02745215_01355 [Desulfitobacterium chlororespirans DSM 11544]|uniref:Uncharacterized protein n=1 Tax=Desulfitobacterium chlororespirans DSM 11544 TaxID=1121395 RepID=A0A1M7SZL4_9FIRM|nr:hypothetical protein SAMN02745215_01355 [Desulfitobacterium chlororespirans DSM 11544]